MIHEKIVDVTFGERVLGDSSKSHDPHALLIEVTNDVVLGHQEANYDADLIEEIMEAANEYCHEKYGVKHGCELFNRELVDG